MFALKDLDLGAVGTMALYYLRFMFTGMITTQSRLDNRKGIGLISYATLLS